MVAGNAQRMYQYTINDNAGESCQDCGLVTYGGPVDPANYQTNQLRRRALEFLQAAPDPVLTNEHWFLYWAPQAPHLEVGPGVQQCTDNMGVAKNTIRGPNHNFATPPVLPTAAPFNDNSSDKPAHVPNMAYSEPLGGPDFQCTQDIIYRDRLDALHFLDVAIGQILNEVVIQGYRDNTVIFFTSDNGYMQGDYRVHEKRLPYEESIRVPLSMIHASGSGGPRIVDAFVLNTDIARTIGDLTGLCDLAYPNDTCWQPGSMGTVRFAAMDGQSLAGYLVGENAPPERRERFLVEHWTGDHLYSPIAPMYPTFEGVRTTGDEDQGNAQRLYVHHQACLPADCPTGGFPEAWEYYRDLQNFYGGPAPEVDNQFTQWLLSRICAAPEPGSLK